MRRWLETSADALEAEREHLNALNVFPVADADTGSNLAVTLRAGADAAGLVDTGLVGELFGICAHQCLDAARGNSGTLLAVLLAGMAEPLSDASRLSAVGLARALEHGRIRVHSALNDPVEGTILSVVDAMARTAAAWPDPDDSKRNLNALLSELVEAAQHAVGQSTEVLPVLRGTGRVDAGALGALIVVDCLAHAVRGEEFPEARTRPYAAWLAPDQDAQPRPGTGHHTACAVADGGEGEDGSLSPGPQPDGPAQVELMCSIELDALSAANLRRDLSELGDSVIMTAMTPAGETMRWKVHVHVPDAADALAVLRSYGRPTGITTESLLPAPQEAQKTEETGSRGPGDAR